MLDRGSPTGLSGLLDLPNVAGATRKFAAWIFAYAESLTAGTSDRAGRGDGDWPEQAYTFSAGSLALTCELRVDGYLVPSNFRGQAGTVTIDHGAGVTQSIPVRVTGVSLKYDSGKNSTDVTGFTCQITDMPTWSGVAGGATQPADDAPGGGEDKTLWAGLAKTEDPAGLSDGETLTVDAWSVADADDDEWAKLAAVIAAATPSKAGLKLRPVTLGRVSSRRCKISLAWARTSTADDQLNPRTVTNADPQNLVGSLTTAVLIDPGSPPADPDPPAGYKLAGRDDYKLNDGATARVYRWALVDSRDAREFEQTRALIDPRGLAGTVTLGAVFTTGSPPATPDDPAGLKLVNYFDVPLTAADTSNQSIRVWTWGTKDSADLLLNPRTTETSDPARLRSEKTTAALIDPGSPPADPGPPAGYKLHHVEDVKEVDGAGTVRVYHWGLVDAADETEFERNQTLVDPNGIRSRTTLAKVFTTGSPPADPAAPSGLKLVEYFDVPLTSPDTSNQSVRVYRWGAADSRDELLNPKNTATADPKNLRGTIDAAIFVGDDAPTTPAGYKLAATLDAQIPEGKTVRVYRYALTDAADDVLFKYAKALTDPNNLTSETVTAAIFTTGSPPADPSPPAGLKLVDHFDAPLTAADTSNQSVRVYRWGLTDSADAILNPKTTADTDPKDLRSKAATAVLFDPGAPPADPAPPSGKKLVNKADLKLNDGQSARVYLWGLNDAADDEVFRYAKVLTDPAGLNSESVTAVIFTTSSPPADPAAPSGLTLVDYFDAPLTAADTTDQSIRVYRWGPLTSAEQIEHRATTANYDPIRGDARETATVVTCLASDTAASLAAAAFAANQTSIAFASASLTKLHKTRALQIIREIDRDRLVRSEMSPIRPEDMKFRRPVSIGDTAAYVRVAELAVPGALSTSARLTHYSYPRQRGVFEILRYIAVIAGAEGGAINAGWAGQVNDAELAGYPARTLMYGLPNIRRRWGLGGGVTAYLLEVAYRLTYDSLGHPDDSRLAVGWVNTVDAATTIGTTGDTLAASYFGVDWVLSWPDQTDMSSLLT